MLGIMLLMIAGELALGWAEIVFNLLRGGYLPAPVQLKLLSAYVVVGVLVGGGAAVLLCFRRRGRRAALRFSLPPSLLVATYGLLIIYDPHGWAGEISYIGLCFTVACILAALGRHVRLPNSVLFFRQVFWGMALASLFQASEWIAPDAGRSGRAFCLPFVVAGGELAWSGMLASLRRLRLWVVLPVYRGRSAWLVYGVLIFAGMSLSEYRQEEFSPLVAAEPTGERAASGPNAVVVVLDTTRADHLSLYGYGRPTTVNLERLASDSAVFNRCIATSAWTLPAHASLFTGLYPSSHGAHLAGGWRDLRTRLGLPAVAWPLGEEQVTLAEILRAKGYVTGAMVANFSYLFRDFGLAQGFSYYSDAPRFMFRSRPAVVGPAQRLLPSFLLKPYRSAREINSEAFSWLDRRRDRPFFLFVNYMEPHHPLLPTDSPTPWWKALGKGLHPVNRGNLYTHEVRVFAASERRLMSAQYDREIMVMDQALGDLILGLKARGLYDNSMIVVVADHGELLGEHNQVGHIGRMLYQELLRVPLVIKYPGSSLKGRFDKAVQQVDIFPTVLASLGVAVPDMIQGEELPLVDHPIVAEQYTHGYLVKKYGERYNRDLTAIYQGDLKYIEDSNGQGSLFDLSKDPGEGRNLATIDAEKAEAVAKELSKWAASRPRKRAEEKTVVSDNARERLRSLGYVN